MKVAIHQPDFLPWLGFFAKLRKSDVFVILDHTRNNPRDAAFWCRRVRIAVNGNPYWLSVPLDKPPGRVSIPICEMRISGAADELAERHLKTIRYNYARTAYFKEVFPILESYYRMKDNSLVKRNMSFITVVKQRLDLPGRILFSSELGCTRTSSELLIEIVRKVGGNTYLSGDGASGYMKPEQFAEAGMNLEFNGFVPTPYPQTNTEAFIAGLSSVDALMNIGFDGVQQLLS